jgi:hypothetical protein
MCCDRESRTARNAITDSEVSGWEVRALFFGYLTQLYSSSMAGSNVVLFGLCAVFARLLLSQCSPAKT